MKYLHYDSPMHVTDSENEEAYAAFMQRAEEYDKQYQKIKGAFSKDFNDVY